MKRPNFDNQEETIKWLDANYPIGTVFKSALSDRVGTRVDEISYTRKGCYATKVNSTEKVIYFLIYNYELTSTPPLFDEISKTMNRPNFFNQKETEAWLNLNYPKGTKFESVTTNELYTSTGEFTIGNLSRDTYFDKAQGCIIYRGQLTKTTPLCDIPKKIPTVNNRPDFNNPDEAIKWLHKNYPINTEIISAYDLSSKGVIKGIIKYTGNYDYIVECSCGGKYNSFLTVYHSSRGLTPTPPLCDLPTSSNADDYFIPGRIYKHKTKIDIFGIYRGETKDNRSFFETLSSNKEVGVSFNFISKHSFEPIFKDKCWCYSGLKDSFDSRKDYSIKNVEEELKITFNNIPLPNQKMDIKKDNDKSIFEIGDIVKLIANTNRSHNKIGDIGTIQEITKINNGFYTYKVKVQDNDSQLTWSIASDLELIKSLIPPKPLIANYPYADVSSKTLDSIQSIGRQERKPTLRKIQEIPQLKNKFHKTKS